MVCVMVISAQSGGSNVMKLHSKTSQKQPHLGQLHSFCPETEELLLHRYSEALNFLSDLR